jgi:hypothetical protein
MPLFYTNRKHNPKTHMIPLTPLRQKRMLMNKKAKGIAIDDFQLHYKATVSKMILFCSKTWHMDQGNKIGIPEMNSHLHKFIFYMDTFY